MIFAMRAEAQKGPFGIYGELIYIGLSDDAQINGLINNVHEQVDATLVDGALSWRLFNQPRWSLDFAAGTHYTNVYERAHFKLRPGRDSIRRANNSLPTSATIWNARLNNDISNSEFLATLTSTIESDIVSRIDPQDALHSHERKPNIPIGPLGGRIREDVAQVVNDFIQAKEAALRIRIDALHLQGRRSSRSGQSNRRGGPGADREPACRHPEHEAATKLSRDNDDWFDPYLGLRGRYNFNKTFYTAVRGEIGGFGVGADLMWEVEGVLGINLTRSIFTEVGYRALGANYENDGFRFDAVMHGPQITTGITF